MNLTLNFTLEELTKSGTAQRLKIDNTPTKEATSYLTKLAKEVLQPIRDAWGAPLVVTSGYRCPKLNKAIGGATRSQHMTGAAADIRTLEDTPKRNRQLFDLIVNLAKSGKITCRQIIDEYGYDWVHVSIQDLSHEKQTNNVLHLK